MMAKDFPEIKHQFDPWHWIKNIQSIMWKKKDKLLEIWRPAIVRHLWWALTSSRGDAELALQKIESLFYHIRDIHEFPHLSRFPACTHDHAQRGDELKPWFVAGSRPYKKLEEAVRGKRGKNLEDLRHLDQCVQTSSVENLFSLVTLVYCRKAVFLR